MMCNNTQEIWLRAYCASINGASLAATNPEDDAKHAVITADLALTAFRAKFVEVKGNA